MVDKAFEQGNIEATRKSRVGGASLGAVISASNLSVNSSIVDNLTHIFHITYLSL